MVDDKYQPPVTGPRRDGRNLRWLGAGTHAGIPASLAAVAGLLLAACGSSGSSAASPGGGGNDQPSAAGRTAVVAVRQVSGVGKVLVDQAGKTLYSPEQEAHGTIRCTGSCLGFWFPVTIPSGNRVPHLTGLGGPLGIVKRPDDGKTQLTYEGRPLYTFRLDQSPGQAHGNNFRDSFGGTSFTWQAAVAGGAAAGGSGPAPASPTGSAYQGPGY